MFHRIATTTKQHGNKVKEDARNERRIRIQTHTHTCISTIPIRTCVCVYSKSQHDDPHGGAATWSKRETCRERERSERRSRQAQVVRYADDGEPVSTEITNENYKTISLEKCQQQIRKR